MPATISKVADRGTHAALDAAATSTLTISNPTLITVGNYLIMRVAGDNSGGGGAARTLTIPNSAAGDPRNVWTIKTPANCDPGAASAGVTVWVCYAKVVTAYQTGDTIILNWSGNIGANAECLEEWTGIHKTTPEFAVPTNQNNGNTESTTLGTAVTGTPNAAGQLFYVSFGWEGVAADTFTQDSDTTNGSWSSPTSVATADATRLNNVRIVGGYKVVTASGAQSWNATITSSALAASAIIFDVDPGNATAAAVVQARTTTIGTPTGTGDAVTTAPVTSGTSTVSAVVGDTDNIIPAVARTITVPAASASVAGGADPPNFGVSVVGTDATLTWDDSPTSGVTTYDIFHRTPSTLAVFTPGSDTALVEGETSPYVHSGLSSGSHDWQVFGVVSAAWTPASLSNLVAWWDASDTGTITESGGAVSQWDDKSGNAYHLVQSTAAYQPVTGSATINSLNAIDFAHVGSNFKFMDVTISQAQPMTFYAVFNTAAALGFFEVIVGIQSGSGQPQFLVENAGNYVEIAAASTANSNFALSAATSYQAVGILNGASSAIYVNQTQRGGTLNVGTGNMSAPRIGNTPSANLDSFQMGEIVIQGGVASASDLTNWDTYCARWGL